MKAFYLLIAIGLFSCSNIEEAEVKDDVIEKKASKIEASERTLKNSEFEAFLTNFPPVDLPLKIQGCQANVDKLISFDEENSSPYLEGYFYALGQIKSNGDYISVLTLGIADCYLPVLTTFKLTGEKIDSKTLAIGYCGDGPCFECSESMVLRPDYSIYMVDTMITSECNDEYEPIAGTESIEIIYKNGIISKEGVIKITPEVEKVVKN